MAKMKIFNSLEEIEFESPPKFNSVERKHFFATSVAINELLENLRTPPNKVCFLISLGYFKARRRFFYRKFMPTDIEFVANRLGVNPIDVHPEHYVKLPIYGIRSLFCCILGGKNLMKILLD